MPMVRIVRDAMGGGETRAERTDQKPCIFVQNRIRGFRSRVLAIEVGELLGSWIISDHIENAGEPAWRGCT